MRITKILLKDFHAFQGEFIIDLGDGKNLLVYGENGSGKSSLYQALNMFFAPPTPFLNHKNIFVTTDDGYVKLEIGDGKNPSKMYEWEQTSHPSSELLILETIKTKGFLDYRALLETHFIHREADSVNVFDLLVNTLLANTQNPITKTLIVEEWREIQSLVTTRKSASQQAKLSQRLSDFNQGLVSLLDRLVIDANKILALFSQNISIQLDFGQGLKYGDKIILNQTILLSVNYYTHPVARHHHFLNEARLSAIAISIYLSALLLNPPSELRVLFLDDVLIGLDMANRRPLLDVLSLFFADWQIILTTFDSMWYQIVSQSGLKNNLVTAKFYCQSTNDFDIPVYSANDDYLIRAKYYLNNDLKASVAYLRTAFEHMMKIFCERKRIPVRYEIENKQTVNDFWSVIKGHKKGFIPQGLQTDLDGYLSTVLNPLSHDAYINPIRAEVEKTLNALTTLETTLKSIK